MTEALPSVTSNDMVLFKKSLFGFKCDEVLSHIEKLNSVMDLQAAQAKTELSAKTNEISAMRQQTVELENEIEKVNSEKELAIADASNQITNITQRAEIAEETVVSLRNSLSEIEFETERLRECVYSAQQENTVLKADNSRLNSTINSLTLITNEYENRKAVLAVQESQARTAAEKVIADANTTAAVLRSKARQEADGILQEANSNALIAKREAAQAAFQEREQMVADARIAKERAEAEAQMTVEKASDEAVRLLSEAEREKSMTKVLLQGSCEDIAESVAILRKELNEVDAKIMAASQQMQNASIGISSALEIAEKNIDILGIQVRKFPENAPDAAARREETKCESPAFVRRAHNTQKRPRFADGILDALNRILG